MVSPPRTPATCLRIHMHKRVRDRDVAEGCSLDSRSQEIAGMQKLMGDVTLRKMKVAGEFLSVVSWVGDTLVEGRSRRSVGYINYVSCVVFCKKSL